MLDGHGGVRSIEKKALYESSSQLTSMPLNKTNFDVSTLQRQVLTINSLPDPSKLKDLQQKYVKNKKLPPEGRQETALYKFKQLFQKVLEYPVKSEKRKELLKDAENLSRHVIKDLQKSTHWEDYGETHYLYATEVAKNKTEKQYHLTEAISAYKKATELDPDNPECQSELGISCYVYARKANELPEKQKYIQKAIIAYKKAAKLKPNDAFYQSKLGLLHKSYAGKTTEFSKKQKYLQEAIIAYQKAVKLDPGDESYKTELETISSSFKDLNQLKQGQSFIKQQLNNKEEQNLTSQQNTFPFLTEEYTQSK